MHLPINLRPLPLLNLLSNNTIPYINNAVSAVPIPPLPASSFSSSPLRSLALHIRRAIVSYQTDVDELRKDLAHDVSYPMKRLLPCAANGDYEIFTNWRSAKFNQLDFSGACINGNDARETKVSFVILGTTGVSRPAREVGVVLSEDNEVLWMSANKGRREWEAIRQGGEVAFGG